MGLVPAALPQNKHWSIGLGAKPSPQRAGMVAGQVWTLGGVGWKKETILLVNAERGEGQMEEYCVYPSVGWSPVTGLSST